MNEFTFKMIKASVPAKSNENVLMSPLSIRLALAMLTNGAQGKTRQRMMDLIAAHGSSIDQVNAQNLALMQGLMGAKDVDLAIANGIWSFAGDPARAEFTQTLKNGYGAEGFTLKDKGPTSVAKINEWFKTNTRGRIPQVIDHIEGDLVLANAIAFDGAWLRKFDKALTRDEEFRLASGKTVPVKMMTIDHESAVSGSYSEDGPSVASIPYMGSEFKALFVLPVEGQSATEMLRTMTPSKLKLLQKELVAEATVSLPRCKMKQAYDLRSSLRAMGFGQLLRPENDFDGVVPGASFISQFVHKTFIEWDEEGTRAAAATEIEAAAADSMPIVFDRPFAFFILHAKSGTVLFAGVCNNPTG